MGENNGGYNRLKAPKNWETGQFVNKRGLSLHYARALLSPDHKRSAPRAHIVYVAGLSEYTEKNYELARDFNRHACNFSTYDRPGQGRSPRLLRDRFKQHSTGMPHSVDDLITFCKTQIPAGEPVILLAHSTGGPIALEAMRQEPDLFKAAIMTAPLFGFKNKILRGHEEFIARLKLPEFMQKWYVPGGGPWRPRILGKDGGDESLFSRHPQRNKIHDFHMICNPALRTGSATIGWIYHKCKAITRLRDPARLAEIKQPVLVFTAGGEHLVDNEATKKILAHLPNARHVHYEDARHELLMEIDAVRDDLLYKESLPFIKASL